MVKALIEELAKLCSENPNVVALIADDKEVYDALSEKYPDQTVNIGISECNAVSVAAGLSACGCIPYVVGGNTFMAYRAYEFIRNQMCMQNRNVKVIGVGAGMAISVLGNTQHATEDMGALRVLPNLKIMTPATPTEVKKVIAYSMEFEGPAFIRVGRGCGKDFYQDGIKFRPYQIQEIKEGTDIAVFASGSIVCDVMEASCILKQKGIEIGVMNVHTIKPFDVETAEKLSQRYKKLISVVEHNTLGGLGSALADAIAERRLDVWLCKMGLQDTFAQGYGTYDDIKKKNRLGVDDIVLACIHMKEV